MSPTFDQKMNFSQAILDGDTQGIRECVSGDPDWMSYRGASGKSVKELALVADKPSVYAELLRHDQSIFEGISPIRILTKALNEISYVHTLATWLQDIEYYVFALIEGVHVQSLPFGLENLPKNDLDDLEFLFQTFKIWPDPDGEFRDWLPENEWREKFERWIALRVTL